ncbi:MULTISPECIES: hypothetical protein [Cyanophyceae]|uniref:hypothetical protein n=1 Tax=Cyanophyceae TaxID=3028117 RepID=UPI0018F03D5B|nr:hypothetical protein [Trichocoleus sp. FACHB-40]
MMVNLLNFAVMHRTNITIDADEIVALGASLQRIDQKILTPVKVNGSKRIWYQGIKEPYFDVFLDLREDNIEWFQFTLRGKSLSWNKAGWQTGITNEGSVNDITFYAASKLINTDNRLDLSFVKLAHSILETRAGDAIFDKILALFEADNIH